MDRSNSSSHTALLTLCIVLSCLLSGCAKTTGLGTSDGARGGDRFEGLFAHPEVAILELRRDGPEYRGSLIADTGKYRVRAVEVDGELRGTVTNGGIEWSFELAETEGGLAATVDGVEGAAPLVRYRNQQAYERSLKQQGGYAIESVRYEPPTTRTHGD